MVVIVSTAHVFPFCRDTIDLLCLRTSHTMTTAAIAKTKMAVATMTATMTPMMSVVLLEGVETAMQVNGYSTTQQYDLSSITQKPSVIYGMLI